MKPGDEILILPSAALSELRLERLAGAKGRIVEVHKKCGIAKGCWVELPASHLGEREWYIPYNSIGI